MDDFYAMGRGGGDVFNAIEGVDVFYAIRGDVFYSMDGGEGGGGDVFYAMGGGGGDVFKAMGIRCFLYLM